MATQIYSHQAKDSSATMTPLVSIIIPTYNYGHFITHALDCVSAQTYTHWECIIVDDGSTDDTATIVASYMETKPAQLYQYIKTDKKGVSQARNIGIELAKGAYLQFLDADDLISPNKLQVQVNILMQNQTSALVYAATKFFTTDQSVRKYINPYPPGFLANESLTSGKLLYRIVKNNPFPISSVLVPKEIVVKANLFSLHCNHNEDWLLWFCIALLKPVFLFDHSPQSFAEIRQHANNTMLDKMKMFEGEKFVRLEMDRRLSKAKESLKLIAYNQDLLALHQIRSLHLIDGMKHVFHRMIHSPRRGLGLFSKAAIKLMGRILDQKA